MGKIDDMRRQREKQFADGEQAPAAKRPKAATAVAPLDTHGRCPECRKTKPLLDGVVASHQKGLGKACPGSRKPPL